ncbi:MAG: Crp/Fnr family transcriptional regulator [Firmicutes bacterium]|nr:Crp/Fnr family transcriptional regulator [Bacillota bacterium]
MNAKHRTAALLREMPLWQEVEYAKLESIAEFAETAELAAGEKVNLTGTFAQTLIIVEKGIMKFGKFTQGGELTLDILPAGAWLNELMLFRGVSKNHFIKAVTSVRAAKISKPVLEGFLDTHPGLYWQLLCNITAMFDHTAPEILKDQQPLETRLARYLLGFVEYRGMISPSGIMIDYPLKVQDMQKDIGAKEGEMIQCLRSFVAREVLDLSERVVITNLELLTKLAQR